MARGGSPLRSAPRRSFSALVAERIRREGIDILVDLTGHTADNRLKLFAAKPALLQITYMGYCNTINGVSR